MFLRSRILGTFRARLSSQPPALRRMTTLAESGRENMPEQPLKVQKVDYNMILKVKKLSENATLPKRGSAGAAGYDLARWVLVFFHRQCCVFLFEE